MTAPVRYGPNLRTTASYLGGYQLILYNRLSELFKQLFQCPLSQGTLANFVDREKLAALDEDTFLRAWWALHSLHPGLHPDDVEQWQNEAVVWKPLAAWKLARLPTPNTSRPKPSTTECG